jgi:hypothetical protein
MPIPKYRLDDLSEAGEESTSSPLAQVLGAVVLGKNDHPTSERTFGSKPSCTSNCSCDYDCKNHCYCVDHCRCDTNCRRDCSCNEGLP